MDDLSQAMRANAAFCAKRVRSTRRGEEKNNASHSFLAWRKMPRSPRLAHKVPAMPAMDACNEC